VIATATLSAADLAQGSALRFSVMRLARRLRQQRSDLTLSLTQLAVLGTLDRHKQLTPRELADHEKVSPPSMTKILAGLEERGLITRTPHPTDGRQQVVRPTREALAILRANRRMRDEWLAKRLAELTRDERAVLHAATAILERLAAA
jgi:DNA-binding MarR family transcriptional regulator